MKLSRAMTSASPLAFARRIFLLVDDLRLDPKIAAFWRASRHTRQPVADDTLPSDSFIV